MEVTKPDGEVINVEPGELIAKYAGYLNRGLSLEDAQLAVNRFRDEYPGQIYDIVEFDPGKFAALVWAAGPDDGHNVFEHEGLTHEKNRT